MVAVSLGDDMAEPIGLVAKTRFELCLGIALLQTCFMHMVSR